MRTDLTRRAIVAGMPLALLAAHPVFRALAWAQPPNTGRLIVQRAVPLAAEMPPSGFGTWITTSSISSRPSRTRCPRSTPPRGA